MNTGPVRGFTLTELLIVVLIIAILAALVISLIGPVQTMIKVSITGTRIGAVQQGLALLGQTEGSGPYLMQMRTEHQAAAVPPDSEPGLGGIISFGPPDPAATGAAAGLPTVGKRPPPLSALDHGAWGMRGRGHLAYPWGKKFPAPGAAPGSLMGPERFRLRDLSPFNTRKLLALAGLLPTKQSDPLWGQTRYMTDRRPGEAWNDAWGHPLVVAAALYQPTWRTPASTPPGAPPGWQDGAWPTPSAPGVPFPATTVPVPFSAYGPQMETPVTVADRSARQAVQQHLKLYQYERSVYVAVAAVGPHAWVPDPLLASATATDWADSPTVPAGGTLEALWAQANWVCQQAKVTAFDQDWDEWSMDIPRWKTLKDDYLTRTKLQADANRSYYGAAFVGSHARCLLSAPLEFK